MTPVVSHRSLSGLSVAAVDPSDEDAVRQWYELCCAVEAADHPDDPPPCWVYELGSFRHPWPGEERTVWLARVAGSVLGACILDLPVLDNLRSAHGGILVVPEYRRRGIGRALLAHLRAEATREDRVRLLFWVAQPLDPAAPDPAGRFAAASGAVPALPQTRRRLDLDAVDPSVLARLERPELRLIDTCTADSNRYIAAINEAMGFRPHRRAIDWQLHL